jgi:hypothetical protein
MTASAFADIFWQTYPARRPHKLQRSAPMPKTPEKSQIYAERTRTIDQIKRLYAVIMGYSATTCLSNIYSNGKLIGWDSYGLSIFIAQGIVFVSLITLFYLGAERMLDMRYLQPESRVPSRFGLLSDLLSCGITAAYFVVLADTFPDFTPLGSVPAAIDVTQKIEENFTSFIHNLLVLYVIDSVLLLIQFYRAIINFSENRNEVIFAHVWWLFLNLVTGFLLYVLINPIQNSQWSGIGVPLSILAIQVAVIHIIRFFLDFLITYRFYYPPWEVSPP